MMRVGLLADSGNADGVIGGAELTMREFAAQAPAEVVVIACEPDGVVPDLDAYIVGNVTSYPAGTIEALEGAHVVAYHNDMRPHGDPDLRDWLCREAVNVFCSPLQRERFPHPHEGGELVPPPLDLDRFRNAALASQERSGAVSLGSWQNHAKAPYLAQEWAQGNGGIDFYGGGWLAPRGSTEVVYDEVPEILARYKTFVFLPTALEPFGRAVVEAWAAGCRVITNRLVGARWWITEAPDRLETAADDFWGIVCG